ncbi:L-aminoadipate-semialdehyde dehydrogenase-phosphopantetheinyl transferase isoform X1 [Dermochelys coriacea]|uniref:L-aminoadipate-semialdehyde dehydrogenase-phosphopantetheinyl transferase isoform X1 n=1 Tax=Dermochelys coriacea TaxID=27794 RepID=UPI0018E90042|nr:L-aminoadipate-semialdehyde dehydrogenase-phosphopantetheinyl transferase isoform X1 [Dermochelys coriacea]
MRRAHTGPRVGGWVPLPTPGRAKGIFAPGFSRRPRHSPPSWPGALPDPPAEQPGGRRAHESWGSLPSAGGSGPVASAQRFLMGSVRWAFPCAAWAPRRDEWLLAARLVQPEEKDRVRQFVFARDAKAAMTGRLLIRKLIAEKLCMPWNEIHLQRTSKGKPFLVNDILGSHPSFNFNISHQGDYAVLAAEPELQVGIDIMKTNLPGSGSIPDFFRIMKRQFTEAEWRAIKFINNEWIQLDMFYRHWALKESFIKAIGIGIGFNLQRIEFNASPLQLEVGKVYKETKMLLDGDKEEGWIFEETRLDDRHHVAVALGKPEVFVQKDSNKEKKISLSDIIGQISNTRA